MISDLQQDLIEEILSRVPVKSLRRLRSTCRGWYHQALFKDPRFIKKHFDKTPRQYHALMVINSWVSAVSSELDRWWSVPTTETDLALGGRISLAVPNSDSGVDVSKAFHCDGILLCTKQEVNMLVAWNPFSGQTRWIQPHPRNYFGIYALGYDNKELFRNYKILRVPCRNRKWSVWEKLGVTPEINDLKPEIYEFSTNSWRSLDAITPQAFINSCGVSLKGSTYWVSSGNGYSLLSFDFSTERFQPLCAPIGHETCCSGAMNLSVVGEERISLIYQSNETNNIEIWMTDEIETSFVSWSKFLTVDNVHLSFSSFMSFFIIDEEKKVFLCCDGGRDRLLVCFVVGEEEYIATPSISVKDRHTWWLTHINAPRLLGYVPKEL